MIYCINIVYGATIGIEDLCIVIANLPFSNFGMNSPNRTASDLMNTEMNRELQYSTVEMASIVARNVPLMNEEQRTNYDRFMLAVSDRQGGFFFLDAPGGTGKTFVISLILAEIRLNIASHWPLNHRALQQLYWMEVEQLIQYLSCH
uniref:ATP-dependent DNA helicase n=1 Tax=Ceratitis capitata TaxID=7213 RepID=W8ADN2_CERCA